MKHEEDGVSSRSTTPRRGVIHDAQGRPDLYELSQFAFSGGTHLKKHRRRCYITAMLMLAPRLDPEVLRALVEAGESALENPGSESYGELVRRLKALGWKFSDGPRRGEQDEQ